jgi:hypothetical protein
MSTALRRFICALFPLALLVAVVGSAACGPNPTAPSSMTGTWVGSEVSSVFGNQSFQLTLTQSGPAVTGSYAGTTPGQAGSFGGPLTGTIQGSSFTATLATGSCLRMWTGTWSGVTLSGTFVATGTCGSMDHGTFSLTLE